MLQVRVGHEAHRPSRPRHSSYSPTSPSSVLTRLGSGLWMTGKSTPTDTPRASTPAATTPTAPGTPTFPPVFTPLPVLEQLSLGGWQQNGGPQTPTGATTPQQQSPRFEYAVPEHVEPVAQQKINPGAFPPELISLITQHLYHDLLPPPEPFPDPDPYLHLLPRLVSYLPPRFAPSPPEQAREVFRNLALVDKTWGEEATRALWRKLSFGMPRAWESVLRLVEEYAQGRRIKRAERMDPSSSGWSIGTIAGLQSPDIDTPRGRGMDWVSEDNKWAAMAGSGRADGRMGEDGEPMVTSPTGAEPTLESLQESAMPSLNAVDSPLLHTKSISFSRFRTAGMNRSVRQGSHERFVTSHRLLNLLRGTRLGKGPLEFPGAGEDEEDSILGDTTEDDDDHDVVPGARPRQRGKLEAVGFTEFMDSAINKSILDELLFRGGHLAEYEEPDEPHHDFSDAESAPSPFPSPFQPVISLPPLEQFNARHLQSSTSRSPIGQRRSSLSSSVAEDSGEEDVSGEDDEKTDDEMHVDEESGDERGRGSSSRLFRPRHHLQRRSSGSAFVAPTPGRERDESEERGRDRSGRDPHPVGHGSRGRMRYNKSLAPPSAFLSRSSSVPAPYIPGPHGHGQGGHHHHSQGSHHRGVSLDTERSSSVPASVSGRHRRGPTRVVQVLEGSTEVKAIRALDLCGCVSKVFIGALEEVISTYHLGPPSLVAVASGNINTIAEYDSEDDDAATDYSSTRSLYSHAGDDRRKLRRTFFPHLRRLGLASSLVPSHLLTSFVLAFPYLTHLDLGSTLASSELVKHLALAGQNGPGGRKMRLKALSLARCRLLTGAAIVGLLCGDCPPFTSMAGMEEDEQWGSGEVVADLTDLSLYGDTTYASPLSPPELRLVISISPAFISGHLRSLDLSSTPMTDAFLADHFPAQPNLLELGLAYCRGISMRGVAQFLVYKAPGVEVLNLAGSAPAAVQVSAPASASRRRTTNAQPTLSIMELHGVLLKTCASVDASRYEPEAAEVMLALRKTNLRVVELDDKTLEALQGGAGDWKPIWGKGRRGWYVDIGTHSAPSTNPHSSLPRKLVHTPRDHPRRMALQRLFEQAGSVEGNLGWLSRKMEVLRGDGFMGQEEGLYAFHAYQN